MARLRTALRRSAIALAAGAGLAAASAGALAQFGFGGGGQDGDKGVLASLISRALSTPATRVSIGDVEGALSSDATIRGIEISDRDGVWLRVDRARIVWRRLALFQRRLEIDRLEVGVLDIRRRPIPAEGPVAGENEPLLPELPVKVEVKAFALGELLVGEPILGTQARVTATGSARLGNEPREGLDLVLDARRLDQPGTLVVRLGLVPQGQRLTLSLKVDEPEGGIVARAGQIPGLPPVKLDIDGGGTLDAFAARLAFEAGPGIGATGGATLSREGTARQLALDLQARIEGLLPAAAAPIFAGTTRLTGRVGFADDGTITLPGIALEAAAARLDVSGTVGRDGVADITVAAANLPNAAGGTAAAGAEIRRLALKTRVTGTLAAPSLDATLAAEDVRLPAGRVAKLDGAFRAVAAGTKQDGAMRLAVTGDARATGVAPRDAALARALGDSVALTLRGAAGTDAVIDVEALEIATPTATARYAGRLGSDELRGRLSLQAASLRPFGALAGLALAGSAAVTAELEGTPRANRFEAVLDGSARSFATGIAAVDGLFGGRLGLAGTVRVEPTGGYAFERLRLAAEHASAEVNGRLAQDTADLAVAAALPDLRRADARLSGRAALDVRVTGGLQRPNVAGQVAVTDATALGRPIPRLALAVDLRDAIAAPDGTVRLDGIVDGKPARGGFRLSRPASGGTRLDALDLAIGSVTARGDLALDAGNLATGRLTVNAPNLDDLSPLLLTRAIGSLKADVTLDGAGGGQGARVKAEADRVSVLGYALTKADADLTLTDIYRRPIVAGRVRVDEARAFGERIDRIRLDAQGTPLSSDVTLAAKARGFDFDAAARILPGERTRIEIARLSANRGAQRLALAGPATLTLVEGGVELRDVALALGSGRLVVNGVAGSRLDLRAEARAVPLSVAEIVAPGLGLTGTFEGRADIRGTPSAPTGEYRARIDGLAAPQTRSLGLPPIDVTASGRLANGRATIDSQVALGRAGSVRIGGSVPAGAAGALDLTVRGGIDAGAVATNLLAAGGRRFAGRVEIDARVGGTVAAPEVSGSAGLAGGTFSDADQGIQLTNVRVRAVARGQDVAIEGGSATTRNGGTLTAAGRVRLDPGAGFPGEIRLGGQNAELVRSGIMTAVANLALTLSGPLAREPRVAGRVDLVNADIAIPEQLPATLKPLPNTRHVNPTRTTSARLALDARTKGKGGRPAPAFDARLDLALSAPGRIVVRGRGLNAELGGNLRLTGTLANPVPNGAFELRRGTLQVVTSRLDFSRGRVGFAGTLTPEIDFAASTNAAGAAIQIAVTGPANNPAFAFTSSPDLPQDEILSRLLFNSPAGQLSAFQALALAQAASQFSGGDDAFEGVRRSLGLSGLDVGLGSGGGIGVGLQRALGPGLSVGVKGGSSAGSTGIGVDYRITDELRIQGEVGATGGTSVGIGAQYEW